MSKIVRVIDPILSQIVREYKNGAFIGHLLFPDVDVDASGGLIIEFDKGEFLIYDTRRSPGGATNRIEFGYEGKPFACENHALEAMVPIENSRDAQKVPSISLSSKATLRVWNGMGLRLEWQRAKTARDPANYSINNKMALSGAARWSDPASNPKADITAGREAVRSQIGVYPNVLTLPPGALDMLEDHPRIQEKFKYTSKESLTLDMLARYFKVAMVVEGSAIYRPSKDAAPINVWGTDAILAYTELGSPDQGAPSFAYTYRLKGHPYVKTPYYDNNRESHIYGVHHERTPVIAGSDAGFLFQSVI